MKKIGLFYWPKGGNVETCARKIYDRFDEERIEIHSIDEIKDVNAEDFDFLIVGGSTVGADVWENADDNNRWFDFFAKIDHSDVKGKPVALFGLGDHILYPDNFVDGMMIMKKEFDRFGAEIVGRWPVEGYDFTGSDAVEDNKFVGLALDEDQQGERTGERIDRWVEQISKEAGL